MFFFTMQHFSADPFFFPTKNKSLCFIDGDHSKKGVKNDFYKYKNLCDYMMFHDIVDSDVKKIKDGGVALFWKDIKGKCDSAIEFIKQPKNRNFDILGLGLIKIEDCIFN